MTPPPASVTHDEWFGPLLQDLLVSGYRLACGMLHDAAAAEDVVQEAALKAWRKRGQLRPESDARPWFLAIVANECRSVRRRRWWSVLPLGPRELPGPGGEPPTTDGLDLRRALRRLPVRDQLVVVLFFYLDLPLDEVARASGLTVTAARSRLYRALKKLRPEMELEEAMQ
ncbi:MAG: RNA polymerase sigma factor [Candidatus Dormibacteraeota bacterium]|nr:RNA polymerase sigma factor [Candidatus Dormibacteraeota bacterium]